MKIRNPKLIALAGFVGGVSGRGLVRTLHFRDHSLSDYKHADRLRLSDRFIYSIWHENLLLPTAKFGSPDLAVLISQHADGQLLGGLIRQMRMAMVCGSTTRGGVEAVRQLLRADVTWRNLAVTPDGPRGPRRVVQQGIIYVASRTGMAIMPIGVGYERPWRLKSWDRFAIPKPGSRAKMIFGKPIHVPPGLRSAELDEYRLIVQGAMDHANSIAESWAETNQLMIPQDTSTHAAIRHSAA